MDNASRVRATFILIMLFFNKMFDKIKENSIVDPSKYIIN